MSIIDHLEEHLDSVEAGWSLTDDESGVKVVTFPNKPSEGSSVFATVGVSKHILPMNGRDVRQEFILAVHSSFPKEQIASFLLTFAKHVISQHRALLRGEVVGPSDSIIPNTPLNAIYVSVPVLFDSAFATHSGTTPPTVIVWLIPIHSEEAEFVRREGWEAFESLLEAQETDLLDLDRQALAH